MRWDELRTEIWAKSPRQGQTRGELLDEHTAQVLHRLAQLRQRFPQLAEQVGDDKLWHRMFWACFLHDIGKAAAPWQAYVRGHAPAWIHRHEIASLAFIPWVVDPNSDDFRWIAAVVASHHRDARLIDHRYDPALADDLALEEMFESFNDEMLSGLVDWFSSAPEKWLRRLNFQSSLVELPGRIPFGIDLKTFRKEYAPASVIQALKAYRRLRRDLEDGNPRMIRAALLYRGLMLLADRLASAHVRPLPVFKAPSPEKLLPDMALRNYQRKCSETRGSVVVVAPTGSGKTEGALLWAQRQQSEEHHRHTLFYVLPYQASINAMHGRLRSALTTEIGLLHGRSTQALYRLLLSEGYSARLAERAARLARDLAQLHRPAVQVTTPYQLLRAAYRLKGFEVIWTALSSALLVVDEIHAYDPIRLGLLLGLLRRLIRDWDARVCAITATMPSWLRDLIQENLGAVPITASQEDFAAFRRHQLQVVQGGLGHSEILEKIARSVAQGQSVLVATNTVRRAQETWDYLRSRLGDDRTTLLHSRFTGRDRLAHEANLLARYGLGVAPRQTGAVVATQTIEVSLNLDFDTIFSEPAPLEALAQRFGRVNRTGRLTLAPVHVLTEPSDGQGVYDQRLIKRTLTVLQASEGQTLDEAGISALLDMVYGDELAAEYRQKVLENLRMFEQFCLNSLQAFDSDDQLEEAFEGLFDGAEVLPATLEQEYRRILEVSPLDAGGLLVPLRYVQLARLRQQGKVRVGPDRLPVINVPYDSVRGLHLEAMEETP